MGGIQRIMLLVPCAQITFQLVFQEEQVPRATWQTVLEGGTWKAGHHLIWCQTLLSKGEKDTSRKSH